MNTPPTKLEPPGVLALGARSSAASTQMRVHCPLVTSWRASKNGAQAFVVALDLRLGLLVTKSKLKAPVDPGGRLVVFG